MSETLEQLSRPLMGVRLFTVDDGYLGSLTERGGRWEPDRPQKATCENPHGGAYRVQYAYYSPDGRRLDKPAEPEAHDVPADNCSCGYYAYYSLADFSNDIGGFFLNPSFAGENVRAVVSAWGDVILCETGFRAEWMQIEALIVGTSGFEHLGHWIDLMPAWEALSERYAVPLIDEEEVDAFCRGRGEVVDSADLAAEAREARNAEIQMKMGQLRESMRKWAERVSADINARPGSAREQKRNPCTSWQEALERKRNQPAFWRDAAGGDVWHG